MGIEDIRKTIVNNGEKSLRISRIPKKTKESFMSIAKEEFEDDYGMTLKHLMDSYEMYLIFLDNFDMKMNYLIRLNEQKENEQIGTGVKTLSGKELKGGGRKNE